GNAIDAAIVRPADGTGIRESALAADEHAPQRADLDADHRFADFVEDDAGDDRGPKEIHAHAAGLLSVGEEERLRGALRLTAAVRALEIAGLARRDGVASRRQAAK